MTIEYIEFQLSCSAAVNSGILIDKYSAKGRVFLLLKYEPFMYFYHPGHLFPKVWHCLVIDVCAYRKLFIRKLHLLHYILETMQVLCLFFFLFFTKNWDSKCCFPQLNSLCFGCAVQMRIVSQQLAGRKQQSQLSHCRISHVNVFILQPRLITASL